MTAVAAGPAQADEPGPVTRVPPAAVAARISSVLQDHPCWSVFWDKRRAVWRAAEDDPDSELYAENSDPDVVIGYIQAHS